jgi:hypothetical protein
MKQTNENNSKPGLIKEIQLFREKIYKEFNENLSLQEEEDTLELVIRNFDIYLSEEFRDIAGYFTESMYNRGYKVFVIYSPENVYSHISEYGITRNLLSISIKYSISHLNNELIFNKPSHCETPTEISILNINTKNNILNYSVPGNSETVSLQSDKSQLAA